MVHDAHQTSHRAPLPPQVIKSQSPFPRSEAVFTHARAFGTHGGLQTLGRERAEGMMSPDT